MTVRYYMRQGHPVPDYVCQRRGIQTAQPICQSIPGTGVDEAIAQVVLEAVTPASLEIALEVFEELRARKAEVNRLRLAQVQRVREEAELAQRQYMLVRPENRLVADQLERQWNEKLDALSRAEEEYRRLCENERPELSEADKERILLLAFDLPQVWKDPRTPARDRKRMLRLLIEDVTLKRQGKIIQIGIRWKGGTTTSLRRSVPPNAAERFRTPPDIVEQIRSLTIEQTDGEITETLNCRGLRTGRSKKFTRKIIKNLRRAYGIRSLQEHVREAGWLTTREVAAQLGIHFQTAQKFAREGVLRACRVNDKDEILFEPITGPLPVAQPGKRFKDRRRYPQCSSKRINEVQYEA